MTKHLYKKFFLSTSDIFVYCAYDFLVTTIPKAAVKVKEGVHRYEDCMNDEYYFLDRSSPLFNLELIDDAARYVNNAFVNRLDNAIGTIFKKHVRGT